MCIVCWYKPIKTTSQPIERTCIPNSQWISNTFWWVVIIIGETTCFGRHDKIALNTQWDDFLLFFLLGCLVWVDVPVVLIHFSPFVFSFRTHMSAANIRSEALNMWFYVSIDGQSKKKNERRNCHIICIESDLQRVGHQHTKLDQKPAEPSDIRTEITINLRPFLILNWVIEALEPVLSHQFL